MLAEIDYFSLENDKPDTSSIAGMKDAILGFDNRYLDNLKKAAHERAIVTCAYELAAFSIEKVRSSPRNDRFWLGHHRIPKKSFA